MEDDKINKLYTYFFDMQLAIEASESYKNDETAYFTGQLSIIHYTLGMLEGYGAKYVKPAGRTLH